MKLKQNIGLKMITKLYSRVAIYIPSQFVDAINQTAELFSQKFGGCSVLNIEGYWKNGSGILEKENITVVYSFTNLEDGKLKQFAVIQGKKLAKRLNQESIAVEVNGEMYLIS